MVFFASQWSTKGCAPCGHHDEGWPTIEQCEQKGGAFERASEIGERMRWCATVRRTKVAALEQRTPHRMDRLDEQRDVIADGVTPGPFRRPKRADGDLPARPPIWVFYLWIALNGRWPCWSGWAETRLFDPASHWRSWSLQTHLWPYCKHHGMASTLPFGHDVPFALAQVALDHRSRGRGAAFRRHGPRRTDLCAGHMAGWRWRSSDPWTIPAGGAQRTISGPVAAVRGAMDATCWGRRALTRPQGRDVNVVNDWRSSLMANSARDPFFRAKLDHEVLVNPAHSEAR
jgi:hypothetical protein